MMNEERIWTWRGLFFGFTNIEDARNELRDHKDMSVCIRVNNESDYEMLTRAIYKMHGMSRVKIINGTKEPMIRCFDFNDYVEGEAC
tara:strand:+ start:923 stop:1183 length:261 start_codon:yes stop_codon:yes gene_type:complete